MLLKTTSTRGSNERNQKTEKTVEINSLIISSYALYNHQDPRKITFSFRMALLNKKIVLSFVIVLLCYKKLSTYAMCFRHVMFWSVTTDSFYVVEVKSFTTLMAWKFLLKKLSAAIIYCNQLSHLFKPKISKYI